MPQPQDSIKLSQLTKELVALNLKRVTNPCFVAAEVVRNAVGVACKARPQEAEAIISDACYGGMQGLMLSEQDLACGAVIFVGALASGAGGGALDRAQTQRAAIAGIARMVKFLEREQLLAIQRKLEQRYPGSSAVFSDAQAAAAA
jgi:hypothetical protein